MKNLLKRKQAVMSGLMLLLVGLACNLPGARTNPPEEPALTSTIEEIPASPTPAPTETPIPSPTLSPTEPPPTATLTVSHVLVPPSSVKTGQLIYDVVSVDTAAEERAPYGDSYDISLLERPFLADMSYIADLDIAGYSLSHDEKFYFVSISLIGTNPNNEIGIQYGVELDLDADGYGDYIVIAYPPHSVEWSTDNVQVVWDSDHDTGGLSAALSDAPLPGDGYDTVIFDGQLELPIQLLCFNRDGSTRIRELDGIGDQIGQHFFQFVSVESHRQFGQ